MLYYPKRSVCMSRQNPTFCRSWGERILRDTLRKTDRWTLKMRNFPSTMGILASSRLVFRGDLTMPWLLWHMSKLILSTLVAKEVQPFPPAMAVRERQGCGVVKAALVVNASCLYRQTARCVLPRESVDWRTSRHPIHRVDHTISQVWGIKPRLRANAPSFFFFLEGV